MIGVQAFELAWRIYLPAHFATTIGLSLTGAGALIMALRLFDSVIDPIVAWASDRFSTRYGQRRPWMVAGLVPILLGVPGVFFLWPSATLTSLVISALFMHLGYMMLVTPHGGWALELGADGHERLRVIAVKTWLGIAGMILIPLVPAILEWSTEADRDMQVPALGAVIILIFPLSVALALATTAEPALTSTRSSELINPFRLFAGILRTPALRHILLLYLCTGFAEAAASATFLLFVAETLGLPRWGSLLIVIQSALSLGCLPFWTVISRRVGRGRLLAMAYGWQIGAGLLAFMLPSGQVWIAIAFVILRGLFSGLDFLFLRAIVSDAARAAADAGLRNGASFYAVSNLTLKLAIGAGAWASLALIDMVSAPTSIFAVDKTTAIRLSYAMPAAGAALLALFVLAKWRDAVRLGPNS